MSESRSEVVRDRIIQLGMMDRQELEAAFGRFIGSGHGLNFASFLLQQGDLSLSQLSELSETIPDDGQSSEASESSLVGQTFSGCRIDCLLARGGMGAVYEAFREEDDLPVVVKFLADRMAEDETARRRFEREGQVLEKLPPHPNLVRVLSVDGDCERPHLVMERVKGLSLDRILREEWCLPYREATRIGREVARGLALVHDRGVVHRDVKPANIVLTPDGGVKLVDFGLAKDMYATSLTLPGTRLGTPQYMAPEQWWGNQEPDVRCDVFALGATLYHLVVGEPPFLAEDVGNLRELILAGEYTSPRSVVPEVPEDLELVLFQMLQVDRRFRYPRMSLCAEDLDRVLNGELPQVPCLVTQDTRQRRFPLLPGRTFVVGRGDECDIQIVASSVTRRHAQLRREQNGFVLRDVGSSRGTFLGRMRVTRPVTLKNGDHLRLGKVKLTFLDPWPRPTSTPGIEDVIREEVPAPLLQGLVILGDRRTTFHLVERLLPDPAVERRARKTLSELLGVQVSREAMAAREKLVARAGKRIRLRLASYGGPEVLSDLEPWFDWWDENRLSTPVQVGAERPHREARLRVVSGEPGEVDLALDGGVFPIGRDERCRFQLTHKTVSRLHATVFRLQRRFVVRDEGSRFGTLVGGERLRLGFLDPGSVVELGEVRLQLDVVAEGTQRIGLGVYAVDPITYQALLELRHPSVATALLGALHEKRDRSWIKKTAEALFPGDPRQVTELVATTERLLDQHARQARQLLPELLGPERRAWSGELARLRGELPPQVVPEGWLPISRGIYGTERRDDS